MKFKPNATNDHVLVNISMSVFIGVDEESDDLPSEFCEAVRNAVKSTGANIVTSSIANRKRQRYLGTAREILDKFPDTNTFHNID